MCMCDTPYPRLPCVIIDELNHHHLVIARACIWQWGIGRHQAPAGAALRHAREMHSVVPAKLGVFHDLHGYSGQYVCCLYPIVAIVLIHPHFISIYIKSPS